MAVTQKQIAQHLGISQTQVAHALSGHFSVSSDTRQRVVDAAQAMGYGAHSNATARQMAARRHGKQIRMGTVAVLMGDFLEGLPLEQLPFFREILRGLHEEVDNYESHIATYYLSRSGKLPRAVIESGVDGAIVVYSSTIEREIDLVKPEIPIVRIGGATSNWHLRPDDYSGIYHVTQHLIALGHRRIAFLGDLDPRFPNFAHDERLRGYHQALEDAGILCDSQLLFNLSDPSRQAGYETMAAALTDGRDFSAAVCLNDLSAFGAIAAAQEAGIGVPEELSITGFDALPDDGTENIELTSVYFDRQRMGKLAVRRIYDALPQEVKSRELLPVHLTLRGSTQMYAPDAVALST
jgi:LacI family transcriptional regulator